MASEVILEATKRLRKKKPLVVSMGNVAASGGYYVACGADTIFADRATITGSIGVVSGKFATRGMWNKMGVHWEPTARGKNAGLLQSSDPLSQPQRERLQEWMDEVYETFKGHVLAARKSRLKKDIEELAGGRVYTGVQAHELGLVDRLGGLHAAIAHAANEAGLKEGSYEVRDVPEAKSFFEELFAELSGTDDDDEVQLQLAWGARSSGLLDAIAPMLEGLDPQRTRSLLSALTQLELLRKENILLAMPPIDIRE